MDLIKEIFSAVISGKNRNLPFPPNPPFPLNPQVSLLGILKLIGINLLIISLRTNNAGKAVFLPHSLSREKTYLQGQDKWLEKIFTPRCASGSIFSSAFSNGTYDFIHFYKQIF